MMPRAYDTIGSRGRNPTAQEYATWGTVRTWFEPGLFPRSPVTISSCSRNFIMRNKRRGDGDGPGRMALPRYFGPGYVRPQ
jgi:hypothetical protein